MKTTRQEDRGPRRAGQAGLLLALCAILAGCGSQAAGDADKTPGAHATAYLLLPLTLAASPHGGAGTDKAVDGAAHVAGHAVPAEDMAPAAAVSIAGSRAAVVRGINQNEEIVGSYRLASGEQRAFIWAAGHGMRDLNDLVKDKPPGLALSEALAISDAGVIVAQGNTGPVLLRPLSRPAGGAAMPLGD